MSGSGFQRMVDGYRTELRDRDAAEARQRSETAARREARAARRAAEELEPVAPPDQRHAVLKARIVAIDEAPDGEVHGDVARVVVLEACDDLGLDAGAEIGVKTSVHVEDANWLVHNMLRGDSLTGTPECGEGSVVTFTGCSMALGTSVVQASSFEVVEAIAPSVGMRM